MTVNARIAKLPKTNAPTFASVVTLRLLGLQVFLEVSSYCRHFRHLIRNAIEELPDARILAAPNLIFRSHRAESALVEHRKSVSDAEGTRQFVGDDDHRHFEDLFKEQNEFIELRAHNRIQPS